MLLEYRILGPLEVRRGTEVVPLAAGTAWLAQGRLEEEFERGRGLAHDKAIELASGTSYALR
jgi:hypothetical protein